MPKAGGEFRRLRIIRLQLRDNTSILSDNGAGVQILSTCFLVRIHVQSVLAEAGVVPETGREAITGLVQALLALSPHRDLATTGPQAVVVLLGWCRRQAGSG